MNIVLNLNIRTSNPSLRKAPKRYVSFNQKTETTKIMKTLKKVLLISASIFLTISTFAQSRENKVNLKFDSKSEK